LAAVASIGRAERLAEVPAAETAGRLYEAYHPRVLRYCTACLRSREEAEDAAQSTFLYALRALERGVEPQMEAPWLFSIARNVCLARHRSRGRRAARETLQDPVVLQDASAAPERADGLVGIEEALATLPENQRRAILLREWQGLTYREIAVDLGLSVAAVETLIFRARRSLAERLDSEKAQEKRRLLRGFDLGSAAAGLKALLGGGGAAKLALAAATVGTVVVAVAGQADAPKPEVTRPAPPPPQVVGGMDLPGHVSARRQTAASAAAAPAPPPRQRKAERGRPAEDAAPPAGTAEPPAVDSIGNAAAGLSETLDSALPPVPELSVPELPQVPVELLPAPEVELPELPLPEPPLP
jgi:RNA polymerase sigma factor (sigma-70 family)